MGRPRCELDVEDIEFLRTLMFSYTKIADILGVSRSTLYRKMKEEGVSFDRYSPVSDQVLDNIVAEIKQSHPNDGEVLLTGHLRSQSIFLPRTRIRASIHRIDPVGTGYCCSQKHCCSKESLSCGWAKLCVAFRQAHQIPSSYTCCN